MEVSDQHQLITDVALVQNGGAVAGVVAARGTGEAAAASVILVTHGSMR